MDINTRYVKITRGRTEVAKKLPVGTYDVTLVVTGDIVKEEVLDNQDGTCDLVAVLKPTNVQIKS